MKDIIDFIQTLPSWVGVLSVFTIIPLILFKDAISAVIKKINPTSLFSASRVKRDISQLKKHDFFNILGEINFKILQVDFTHNRNLNEFKRDMMIILISLKMKSIESAFLDILNTKNLDKLSSQDFKFLVIKSIQSLIEDYNKKAVDEFIKKGVNYIDSTYFVSSYEKYRATIIDSFVDRLESICSSTQYNSNYSRMLAMLEVLSVAVEVIPRDVKSLYVLINGRYDKYNENALKG